MTREEKETLALLLEEKRKRRTQRLFFRLFPDQDTVQPDGSIIYARSKYPKHLEFFEAGATYRERAFMAGNRIGKTTAGGYEVSCHLTGLYPKWWPGRRFEKPISAWAAGKTAETTRDSVQLCLMGDVVSSDFTGTGMIPGHLIGPATWTSKECADTVKVKHVSGGWSRLGFKSYKQGRGSFEATSRHVIWLDEECPKDIYGECLIRTATTNGIVLATFSPLEGRTETVLMFTQGGQGGAGSELFV